jgi:hypothetical protein
MYAVLPDYPRASGRNIASITPTLCDLMGVSRPALSSCEPMEGVLRACGEAGGGEIEVCLVYAPDAVGRHVLERYPGLIKCIREAAPAVEPLESVFPPKTPVCFASMFTGAPPEAHGIREYEQPVLRCDTLFDAFVRARKRPAIVSVEGASVDVIFRGRGMDYFSEPGDSAVTARVLELLAAGRHDLILAYHQEYDDVLHGAGAFAPDALAAVKRHLAAFREMVERARGCWAGRPGLMVFAPDHGAHDDPDTGKGTHGRAIAEDMELLHFFGVVT